MKIIPTTVSSLYGGAETRAPPSQDFSDSANDLNATHSIKKVEFNAGWVVDGMRVTYNAGDGLNREVIHGSFNASKVGDNVVTLTGNEYISHVEGVHGRPNDQYDFHDCIQKIKFTIRDPQSGKERTTGYFGRAYGLAPNDAKPFSWDGHLFAFAGRADNGIFQVGLKGLAFVQASDPIVVACSVPYAGGDRPGRDYDDVADFGTKLNFKCPIKKLIIWSGQVVDGIEVTYNLADKSTKTLMHGAKGGNATEVPLSDDEIIIEIKGLHGVSHQNEWGNQVQLITFLIYNSRTRFTRTTKSFGVGTDFHQETRKDIAVTGPLIGLAGRADNEATRVGLNTVKFYTLIPA